LKTADYTALAADAVGVTCSTVAITITLPAAPAVGAVVGVRKRDTTAYPVYVAPGTGHFIDDYYTPSSKYPIAAGGSQAQFAYVGSGFWYSIAATQGLARTVSTANGFPASPVSGTSYQSGGAGDVIVYASATLNPTTIAASSCVLELSANGSSWTEAARTATPVGVGLAALVVPFSFIVPQSFFWRVTLVNATLSALYARA